MRPLDQRPGERHALLLAAGELARPPVEKTVHSHERCDLPRAALGLGPLDRLEAQREHDVVEYRHVRIQRIGLKDNSDVAASRFDVVDPRAIERDIAAGRLVDTREHHECRRFAAAGRPEHRHEGAILDREIEASDRRRTAPLLA